MKPRATLHFLTALASLYWLDVHTLPLNMELVSKTEQRTALPLLLLLSYPLGLSQVGTGGLLPGIPLRRPQDESTIASDPPTHLAADEPQNDAIVNSGANAQIREQFIQGLLQGLQSMTANGGASPPIQPAVLADFLQQVMATQGTKAPGIEKEAQRPSNDDNININNDNDPDYDYIDFKNGSRIKYDLDNDQQLSDSEYTNKTLQQPAVAPPNYGYYRPQLYG